MTDIRIAIFGAASAGKTRFLWASLNSLLIGLKRANIEHGYLDDSSRSEAQIRLSAIREGNDAPKTHAPTTTAVSLWLRDGRGASFIRLLDETGEQYSQHGNWDFGHGSKRTNRGSLRYIEAAQAVAYVLDPFSVGLIRDQAATGDQAVVAQVHAAQTDPEIAYAQVVNRHRGIGVPTATQRLAVIVSKTDLLRQAGLAIPTKSADVAAWLTENGMRDLVLATAHEFSEVRFFTVASLRASAGQGDDPGIPLRWLLATHGIGLPDTLRSV